MLLTILKEMGKMVKLFPHRLTYPDPNVQEAKRPKKVEIPPKEFQNVQGGGMYMFTVKTNAGKQYLWLALMIFAAFFFLLFRVWPEWLRVGVWYVSYYMLVFLVSKKKITSNLNANVLRLIRERSSMNRKPNIFASDSQKFDQFGMLLCF